MQAAWISEYKREIERKRRNDILVRETEEHGTDKAYEIRKKLFDLRYDEKDGQEIDYFIRGWVNLHALERRVFLPGEKRRLRKELDAIKADWQFALCEEYGEEGAAALYDELFNMSLLYIDLCERDKMYNSVLLGLGTISNEKRARKIALEINKMTTEIPENIGATEELSVFIRAAREALSYKYAKEAEAFDW